MRTDPDGLPHHDDRLKMQAALRATLAERLPGADGDAVAAIGALAASRFFGVRFRAEGNGERAWVARRPNPDVCEIWDPLGGEGGGDGVWGFLEKLPDPDLYRPTPEGAARIAAKAQTDMAAIGDAARLTHALALGVEPDEV